MKVERGVNFFSLISTGPPGGTSYDIVQCHNPRECLLSKAEAKRRGWRRWVSVWRMIRLHLAQQRILVQTRFIEGNTNRNVYRIFSPLFFGNLVLTSPFIRTFFNCVNDIFTRRFTSIYSHRFIGISPLRERRRITMLFRAFFTFFTHRYSIHVTWWILRFVLCFSCKFYTF